MKGNTPRVHIHLLTCTLFNAHSINYIQLHVNNPNTNIHKKIILWLFSYFVTFKIRTLIASLNKMENNSIRNKQTI